MRRYNTWKKYERAQRLERMQRQQRQRNDAARLAQTDSQSPLASAREGQAAPVALDQVSPQAAASDWDAILNDLKPTNTKGPKTK